MTDRVIQFVLSTLPESEAQRLDCLSQSIIDTLLPSLAETSEVSSAELAAKTLVELAYIVGFTHRAEHSMALMAAVSKSMRSGMQDYQDENLGDQATHMSEDENDAPLADMERSALIH